VTGPRQLTGDRLVIASHNAGKVREMGELLAPFAVAALAAGELGLAEPEETGSSFAENAELKALLAARVAGLPALADDSGLVVPALDGAPGIFSGRWAGEERDFDLAMAAVNRELEALPGADRRAHFAAALCLAWPDGHLETFMGRVEGSLVWPPRGRHGFGYDPMFVAAGHELTFGEFEPGHKHAISHRADAFAKLAAACLKARPG
jgi:XTP/dITP diphosphohydrolase